MKIDGCPRCGGDCMDHAKRRPFTVPVEQVGFEAHEWAMCLSLREPVLFGYQRRWAWVRVFRWQIAQVFSWHLEKVAQAAPLMRYDMARWIVAEPTTSANGDTYRVEFGPPGTSSTPTAKAGGQK